MNVNKTLKELLNSSNNISPSDLVKLFKVKIDVLEKEMNLPSNSLNTNDYICKTEVQFHLKNIILVIELASKFCENYAQAFKWYSTVKLPSFGARTAAELVSSGNINAIIKYLERIDTGGYT